MTTKKRRWRFNWREQCWRVIDEDQDCRKINRIPLWTKSEDRIDRWRAYEQLTRDL